jgi:hypothetical protein
MADSPWLSEALYTVLCHVIGTPTEVTIRRDKEDMKEVIEKPVEIYRREIDIKWLTLRVYPLI